MAFDTSLTAIDRPFAGQSRRFQLRYGEIGELERVCGAGIGAIMMRVAGHQFSARDVWETIRLGLEGGGMEEPEATATVMRYHGTALAPHLQLVADILCAAVSGVERSAGKEEEAGVSAPATSPPSTPPGDEPA